MILVLTSFFNAVFEGGLSRCLILVDVAEDIKDNNKGPNFEKPWSERFMHEDSILLSSQTYWVASCGELLGQEKNKQEKRQQIRESFGEVSVCFVKCLCSGDQLAVSQN